MVDFQSPGTKVVFKRRGPVALPGVSSDIGGFQGVCTKGPINRPILVQGPDDFREVFGPDVTDSFLVESVNDFFDEGGETCYVNRVAHYSDITDPTSLTAIAAQRMLQTTSGAATPGSITSNASSFPVALAPGDTFVCNVNAGGNQTATIQATPATKTGSGGTYAAVTPSNTLVVSIVGFVGNQTITFTGSEATEAAFLATINSQLIAGYAADSGGNIKIFTDRMGSSAAGSIVSGDADVLASTGLSVGAFTNAGPNNVSNVNAVTASELATIFEAAYTAPDTTSTANGNNSITLASVLTGTSASIQFTSGTGVSKVSGFDLALHSGSAASGATNTLLVKASSEGAWGNAYKVTTAKVDTVVAETVATVAGNYTKLTFSAVSRVLIGDTLKIVATGGTFRGIVQSVNAVTKEVTFTTTVAVPTGGLAGGEDVTQETFTIQVYDEADQQALNGQFLGARMSPLAGAFYVEALVNSRFRSPIEVTDQLATADDPRPADLSLGVLSGGDDGGAIVDSDHTGNASAKTGLFAFNKVDDVAMVSIPGVTTAAVWNGYVTYAESRQEVQIIPDFPQGLVPEEAIEFLQVTANVASMFLYTMYPWVKGVEAVSGLTVSFPPSGHVQGVIARTVREVNIGQVPAGDPIGKLRGNVTGVDFEVHEEDYDLLYPANINAIQVFKGSGICIFGSRTLDPTGEFGQFNVVKVFLTLKRQLKKGTRFVNFLPNDEDTRQSLVRTVQSTLRQYRIDRILKGKSDDEAFFIICDSTNNTEAVVNSGKMICRIGLAINRATEFLEFTLEQFTSTAAQ